MFEKLRKLRSSFAVQKKVPAYIIFNDASLKDMVDKLPSTTDEFAFINGVGKAKLENYANAFLEVINHHQLQNSQHKDHQLQQKPEKTTYSLEEKREVYKNAYRPWTFEDDEKLKTLISENWLVKDISKIFDRNTGAIRSRIKKLKNAVL